MSFAKIRPLVALLVLLLIVTTGGVSATWFYAQNTPLYLSSRVPISVSPWVPIPEQEIDIVNKFTNILNDKETCDITIGGVTYTSTSEALIAAFNSSPKGTNRITLHNNSYIGTMQTTGEDVQAVRDLFGSVLTKEEGASEDYSLMLKREPLDGDDKTGQNYFMDGDHGWREENAYYPGSEMILFSTNWKQESYTPSGYVVVYATVFTRYPLKDANGDYLYERDANGNIQYHTYVNQYGQTVQTSYPIYQYGEWMRISGSEAFIGHAQVVDYSTGDKTRSFATGTWRSTEVYGTQGTNSSLDQVIRSVLALQG